MVDLVPDDCTILLRDFRAVQTQSELLNLSLDVCHLVRNIEAGNFTCQDLLFDTAVDVFLDLFIVKILVLEGMHLLLHDHAFLSRQRLLARLGPGKLPQVKFIFGEGFIAEAINVESFLNLALPAYELLLGLQDRPLDGLQGPIEVIFDLPLMLKLAQGLLRDVVGLRCLLDSYNLAHPVAIPIVNHSCEGIYNDLIEVCIGET